MHVTEVKVGIKEVEVSMFQFMEDTLFISKAQIQNIMVIKSILRCFQLVLCLKVSFHKTRLGEIELEQTMLQRFLVKLNYNKMFVPFTYLEVPVGKVEEKIVLVSYDTEGQEQT